MTPVAFDLPEANVASLRVFDTQGRLVCTLTDRIWPAGRHSIRWIGTDHGTARPDRRRGPDEGASLAGLIQAEDIPVIRQIGALTGLT